MIFSYSPLFIGDNLLFVFCYYSSRVLVGQWVATAAATWASLRWLPAALRWDMPPWAPLWV